MPGERRRLVTVIVASAVELSALLVDARQGVFFPRIPKGLLKQDDALVLDVRLPDRRVLLPGTGAYTQPERRGPLFVCAEHARGAVAYLLARSPPEPQRAHLRYPLDLPVEVTTGAHTPRSARLVDVSTSGASLAIEGTPHGDGDGKIVIRAVGPSLLGFPRTLSARVTGQRAARTIVHFRPGDQLGWRELRRFLRRIDETGEIRQNP